MGFEPPVEFAQTRLESRINLTEIPEPIAFDLEFEKLRSSKHPSQLPVAVQFENKLTAEIMKPLGRIIFPLPLVDRDGAKRLLDLHELSLATGPAQKIPAMMHDRRADNREDRFQHLPVRPSGSLLRQHISSAPAALDRLVEFDDRKALLTKRVMLADGGDHLPVHDTA